MVSQRKSFPLPPMSSKMKTAAEIREKKAAEEQGRWKQAKAISDSFEKLTMCGGSNELEKTGSPNATLMTTFSEEQFDNQLAELEELRERGGFDHQEKCADETANEMSNKSIENIDVKDSSEDSFVTVVAQKKEDDRCDVMSQKAELSRGDIEPPEEDTTDCDRSDTKLQWERASMGAQVDTNEYEDNKKEVDEMIEEQERETEEEVRIVLRRFECLVSKKSIKADEWKLVENFLDHPRLVMAIWTMIRTWKEEGKVLKRKRCGSCEEVIGDTNIKEHRAFECIIPLDLRCIYMLRAFGKDKCIKCGRLSRLPHYCRPMSEDCLRCENFGNAKVVTHSGWTGACQWIRKVREQIGRQPTWEDLEKTVERNDEKAKFVKNLLLEAQAKIERKIKSTAAGSNEKREGSMVGN